MPGAVGAHGGGGDHQIHHETEGGWRCPLYWMCATSREAWPPPMWPRPTRPIWPRKAATASTIASYWVDEKAGKIFCLVAAPSAEAANAVHREAHGLVADEIFEVSEH